MEQTPDPIASAPEPKAPHAPADAGAPIFIVGCERSGTTLLRAMLNAHPVLFIPRESHFIEKLIEYRGACDPRQPLTPAQTRTCHELIVGHRRWKDWECDPDALWEALSALEQPTLASVIATAYRQPAAAVGATRWGDKTPSYVALVPEIAELFPDALFVHIIRDGRDVCVSFLKTQWLGPWVTKIAERWLQRVSAGRRAAQALPGERYLEVRYEDLVAEPGQALRRICAFVGITFEDEMLEYHRRGDTLVAASERQLHQKLNRPPQPRDVQRFRNELPAHRTWLFEACAHTLLRDAGYSISCYRLKRVTVYPALLLVSALLTRTARLRRTLGLTRR